MVAIVGLLQGGGGAPAQGSLRPRMLAGMAPKRGGFTLAPEHQPEASPPAPRAAGLSTASSPLLSGHRQGGSHFESAIASDGRPRPGGLPPAVPPLPEAHRPAGAASRSLKRSLSAGGGTSSSTPRRAGFSPPLGASAIPFSPDAFPKQGMSPDLPPHDATTIEPVMVSPTTTVIPPQPPLQALLHACSLELNCNASTVLTCAGPNPHSCGRCGSTTAAAS